MRETGDPRRYISPEATPFETPPVDGSWETALVPDTFDLSAMIELAINGLTGPTDPAADHEIYFWVNLFHEPPVMTHDLCDWCQPKFYEALPLLRHASGSTLNTEVDESWRHVIARSTGPDGMYYYPFHAHSWSRLNGAGPTDMRVFRKGGAVVSSLDPSVEWLNELSMCGRVLNALHIGYLRDPVPGRMKAIEKMVLRMDELALRRDDHAFFAVGYYEPGAEMDQAFSASAAEDIGGYGGGRAIEGLSKLYRTSGFEPAAALARRLVRAVIDHANVFDRDGVFLSRQEYGADGQARTGAAAETRPGGHFHYHTIVLINLLEHALASADRPLLDFCRRSYEWARLQGSTLTGCFPTVINPVVDSGGTAVRSPWYDECEICEVADMITLALKLSSAGAGDYYDDAERWIRNFFAEGQLSDVAWVAAKPRYMDRRRVFANESTDRVAERNIGAFGGWMSGNDWATRMGVMHCCTGNATRTLYYIWEHVATLEESVIRVNLRFTHATPYVEIADETPYRGRTTVTPRRDCPSLLVHAPEWVAAGSPELSVTRAGSPVRVGWRGRYVDCGPARAGQQVVLDYPINEVVVRELLTDSIYTLVVRGNTVVSVDPPGRHHPLFRRAHWRSPVTAWKEKRRFIPSSDLRW